MTKLDLGRIWRDHNKSFSGSDWFTFYGLPLCIGGMLALIDIRVNATLIGILATALSVFCALLFGLLIPVIDQARRLREREAEILRDYDDQSLIPTKVQESVNRLEVHSQLAEQLFANVCFAILASLAAVLVLVVLAFMELPTDAVQLAKVPNLKITAYRLISAAGYFLTLTFFLTMAMLLRRMYTTFVEESNRSRK